MSMLDRQIGIARRRLDFNTLFDFLSLGAILAAAVLALLVGLQRTLWPALPLWWLATAVAGLTLLGTLLATMIRRATPLRAAVAIDAAASLKERLSTALAVRREQGDPFVVAAVADAEQAASRVHVPAHLPLRAPRLLPWSFAALAAVALLSLLLPRLDLLERSAVARAATTPAATSAEQRMITEELRQRINRVQEMAKDNPALADLAADLKPIEFPEHAPLSPEDLRREAVKKLDEVRDRLEEQKKAGQLEGLQQARRQLEKIDPQKGADPAAKLSQSLANGDMTGAKEALSELQKQLEESAKNATDPAAQRQLTEMGEKLQKLADQIAELNDSVRIQKDLEQAGLSPEQARQLAEQARQMDAKELEKQLQQQLGEQGLSEQQMQELVQKLQQQAQSQQQLEQLQQALAQAAEAAQQCNQPGSEGQGQAAQSGAQALSDAMGQLSQMEMAQQALNELQAQLSELQNLRQELSQSQCQLGGQARGDQLSQGSGGFGIGMGERGRQKAAHDMKAEKAKVRMTRGQIIGQMLVDGPQVRGEMSSEVREAVMAAQREAQDAIDRQAVPRQYERITQEYFEKLAGLLELERAGTAGTDPPPKPAAAPAGRGSAPPARNPAPPARDPAPPARRAAPR